MAECVASKKTIDILTCAICLEKFIKPKSLPCLHTFCEGCILTFITSELEKLEGNNHIECPVCRATVQLPKKECTPKEFVDQMPTNFLINGLLEKETTKRSEIKALKCDNVVTIEDEASKLCTDVKLERLKMDITNVSNDFDTLLSHYTECLQSNETQYEDKQKMIEISISTIISKVKALEITKKAELKKIYEEKKHILEDKMDTCTNCKKTVVSDKQTLEINIETASEVQVMFEAQKIASQVEKHKQLLKKYKFDGSKILISGGTGIPVLIDVFINSLFKISISNEDKILKLLTDDSSQNVNPVQKSSSNQSVGECLNPNKDKSDNIISGFKFGNATLDKKSPGISLQSGATSESSAEIKFGQTTKKADSTNPACGIETEFAGQTVSTVKTTTTETYTGKPPIVGGYKFEKLPESDKKYPTSEAVSLYPIVSSTFDKKTKPIKPDQSTIKFNKSTLSDFTIQQTAKPSGFTIQQTAKPSGFTIHQTAKPSGFTIQQTAKPSGFTIHQTAKPSDFTIQQTAKPSGFTIQQTAKPSGFTIHQTAKPSGFTIQQTAKPSGVTIQQTAKPSGFTIHQTAKPSGFTIQQTAKPSGVTIQQTAKPSGFTIHQTAKPSGFTIQQTAKPSGFTIHQTAKPSDFTIQQTAKPSGFTIQQTAKPSGFTIQQTAKQFGFSFGGETITSKPASSFTFKSSVPISTASPAPTDTEITNKTVASKASTFLGFSSSIIQPEHAKKDEKKVFGNHSNPKEGVWNCNGCLMSNKCYALKCPASGTLKPGVIKEGVKAAGHPQKKDGENGFGDYLFKHQDGSWKCDGCLCSNNSDILKYPVCDIMKPCDKNLKEDLPKEKGKSSAFGSNAGGFNFGGKSGFTFGTDGESNTKAASEFTFPTPDLAKKKSELNPPSTVFSFTSIKSDAERKTPDVALKGFKFTLPPCVTAEQSTELQRSIFGTSPGAQNAGTVNCQASSTSPDKLLANPVSMVTSVAPGSSASKGAFSFGQQSFKTDTRSTSSFGQFSSTTPGGVHNLITSATKASTTTPGADGNTCKFPLKENIIACKLSKETSLVNSPLKTSDGYMDQGYEPNVNFKPVIDLPDLIETQTDEEEEAVFCEQATLFRFDNGQWKENTIVQLKLLRLKQTKRARLFMRRDRVLKVCANHFLTKEMKLSPMQSSKKAWYWDVHFQYKGKIQITKIAVCFKGEDLALKFKATFEKMQSELDQVQSNQVEKEHAKTVNTDKTSLGSMFKIEERSWHCPSCLVINKSDVQKCATCRTLKNGTKREDVKQTESKSSNIFGLPSGVSNLGHPTQTRQMPAVGFFSQAIRSQTLQFQEGQITTGKVEKKDPPLMSSSLVSMSSTQSVNSAMYTIPGAQPQSTESHQPIDGPSPGAHTAGTVSSSSSNLTTLPLVCSLQSASTSPDKPLANPVSMVTTNAPGSSAPKGIFRFGQQPVTSGTQSTFSFGHVPSLNPGAGKNISPSSTKASTTNPGAVGNICISPQKKNVIACKSSKETSLVTSPLKISDNSVLRGKEPDFKPVIDLPDGVETKNGEKEGETVFCEKATLLRFDDGFWKERGSGELQLLRHKQTKRVQLLMRQDQVLNIYAKHFLTKEMKLYPLKSSEMAWSWIAEDLSEGEVKIQYFVVCFKDEDLALKFKATFEILQTELQKVKSNQVQNEPVKTGTFGSTSGTLVGPGLGHLIRSMRTAIDDDSVMY
ncbi:uncharacterized protein LOC143080688 [Mytilus galloprovincialis]|uniref:uncharacterized protein LOC143080688 n=1 Tax=Mytilus galloprovincialis TaxID=29158 RepID=UPI003F7B7613